MRFCLHVVYSISHVSISYRLATIVLSKGTFVSVARNVHSYYMNYQPKGPSYSMFVHTND